MQFLTIIQLFLKVFSQIMSEQKENKLMRAGALELVAKQKEKTDELTRKIASLRTKLSAVNIVPNSTDPNNRNRKLL